MAIAIDQQHQSPAQPRQQQAMSADTKAGLLAYFIGVVAIIVSILIAGNSTDKRFDETNARIAALENQVRENTKQLHEVKADITVMKFEITEMKSDIAEMKSDITEIKRLLQNQRGS